MPCVFHLTRVSCLRYPEGAAIPCSHGAHACFAWRRSCISLSGCLPYHLVPDDLALDLLLQHCLAPLDHLAQVVGTDLAI